MITKVNKILIGKDIDRTVAVVDGADMTTLQENLVEGEIVVLDKNFNAAIGAGVTYDVTDTIFIAEGSSESFETTNPDGTTLTGRRLIISSPINGAGVTTYNGESYSAKSEAVAVIPAITDTIVAGTEYVLRIVYKGDIAAQVPGQNTETFRYIAKSGDDSDAVLDGLATRVNRRSHNEGIRRGRKSLITASFSTPNLTLTARPVLSCTTSVDDIDELVMNDFDVYLNYVDSDYLWTQVTTSGITYTGADKGVGTWELVRDIEKHAQSYEGIMNRTWFPIIKPAMRTVKGATYDIISIEHDAKFRTPDNQYNKETSLATQIALPVDAGQATDIVATLNAWMASTPKQFAAISI